MITVFRRNREKRSSRAARALRVMPVVSTTSASSIPAAGPYSRGGRRVRPAVGRNDAKLAHQLGPDHDIPRRLRRSAGYCPTAPSGAAQSRCPPLRQRSLSARCSGPSVPVGGARAELATSPPSRCRAAARRRIDDQRGTRSPRTITKCETRTSRCPRSDRWRCAEPIRPPRPPPFPPCSESASCGHSPSAAPAA